MEELDFFIDRHTVLDNFAPLAIYWRGDLWPTVEHAYQAAKFTQPHWRRDIRETLSPYGAKKRAQTLRQHVEHIDPDWYEKKLGVMEELLRAKLQCHPEVHFVLMESGDAILVEGNTQDAFWGIGPRGDGENHLGRIWMKLRDELFVSAT